jgi:SAM-dependent methyltransferase
LQDVTSLPVADDAADMIIANFCLPWTQNAKKLLPEWRRVLKADGVLVFNAFGPATLQDYQTIWGDAIIPGCSDIHQLGDSLTQSGFLEPVLDCNFFQINYRDQQKMLRELQISGMLLDNATLPTTTTSPCSITFELIQAHTFAANKQVARAKEGVAKISLADVKKSLRK